MNSTSEAILALTVLATAGMGSCVEVERPPRKIDYGPPPPSFDASPPKGRWEKCVERRKRHLDARKRQRGARKRQRRCK